MTRLSKGAMTKIGVFILVLYFSTLPFKHLVFFWPPLVPITLMVALLVTWLNPNGSIGKGGISEVEVFWMLSALMVVIDNVSLGSEFISGGVVQFLILVTFVIVAKYRNDWEDALYRYILFFLVMHAIATIVFIAISPLYTVFVNLVYPSNVSDLMHEYTLGRYAGLCAHYSTNGIYLAEGIGISFVGWLEANTKSKKRYLLLLLIFMVALLICGKRGPLVFSMAACLMVYILYFGRKVFTRIFKVFAVAIVGILLLYISAEHIPALNNTIGRFSLLSVDATGGRDILYDLAIEMFLDAPILGHGWGSYKYHANQSVIGSIYGRDSNMLAHNCYLQLLAEIGIVGFIVFVVAFAASLTTTIKLLVNTRNKQSTYKKVLTTSLYMQLFFLMYCMTGNPLYDYTCIFPYLLSVAVAVSCKYKQKRVGS